MADTKDAQKKLKAKREYVDVSFKRPKHAGKVVFTVYKDEKTGETKRLLDANGKPISYTLTPPKKRFYLDRPDELRLWDFIKGHPFLYPEQDMFLVNNTTESAKQKNDRRKKIRSLENQLDAMETAELENFSRLFGLSPEMDNEDVIRDKIVNFINDELEEAEQKFNDKDKDYRMALAKALYYKVVTLNNDGLYYFNEMPMGTNDNQSVQWLKDNPELYDSIVEETTVKLDKEKK